MPSKVVITLFVGVLAAVGTSGILIVNGLGHGAATTAGLTVLCAIYWIFEPIPIAVTALIPAALLPVLGVLDHQAVALAYGHHMVLLLMGGFMLSKAIEHCGLHRRIAFGLLTWTGTSPRRIVLGFMLASAISSMWISNTATTLMLLPVALAVISNLRRHDLAVPLLLGIAYAANIGGIGTKIGTPPNLIFVAEYERSFGTVSFLKWMTVGVPVVVILIPIVWWLLVRGLPRTKIEIPLAAATSTRWTPAEKRTAVVFVLTALAWIFRSEPFGGWSGALAVPAKDSTVALCGVLALFMIPNGERDAKANNQRLLDWPTAASIPWGLLLLFGGGIALSIAFQRSGLSAAIGQGLVEIAAWPALALTLSVCLSVTFATEVTSNTAMTALLLPILGAAASTPQQAALLMLPATLSASCAFMLPVATAPNAIVAGTGLVTTRQMLRHGFVINLVAAVVIGLVCAVLLRGSWL